MNEEQRHNLLKHAFFVIDEVEGKRGFDMNLFSNGSSYSRLPERICGTVACFLGYAPLHIPPTDDDYMEDFYSCRMFFSWNLYENRVFDLGRYEYAWLFNEHWVVTDNTAIGAAKRALWLLEYGLPDDAKDQMNGINPLCYVDLDVEKFRGML